MSEEIFGWTNNPFNFTITPECFSGNEEELHALTCSIKRGEKFSLIIGPTGSGKTTVFKLLSQIFTDSRVIYLPKPPKQSKEWLTVFQELTTPKRFFSFLRRQDSPTLFTLSERVSQALNGQKCILLVDECHEASVESLEWMRTITDHIDNLHIIMGGLPTLETLITKNLETLLRRVTTKVRLANLSKAATREMIKKRIEQHGGEETKPFTQNAIEYIYERSGGFPRDVLRTCNELVQIAQEQNLSIIDADLAKTVSNGHTLSDSTPTFEELPEKQQAILQILADHDPLPPSKIVSLLNIEDYKDQDNAIRSINNLLKRLLDEGFVERSKTGKTFKYTLAQKHRTFFVKA